MSESRARRPWVTRGAIGAALAAALLTAALAAAGLPRLEVDVSNEAFFVEGDPVLARYDDLLERFGSDEVVYVLVEVPDAFAEPHLQHLIALGDALARIERVVDVRSPLHSPVLVSRAGAIEGVRVAREALATPAARAGMRDLVLGYAPFRGLLIDAEGRRVGYVLRVEAEATSPQDRAALARAVAEVLAAGPWRDYPHAAVGTPLNAALFAQILAREVRASLLGGLAVGALVLLALFRTPRAVLAAGLLVGGSQAATLGLMGLCGAPLSTVSMILVTFLICAGVADAVHLLVACRRAGAAAGRVDADALARGVREVWRPCLLTSVTTAAGFLALLVSDLRPVRHLGLFAAAGCLVTYALTFALLPPLLLGWRVPAAEDAGTAPTGALAWLHARVVQRPGAVALGCALALLLAAAGLPRLRVDHDFLAYLDPQEPLRRQIEFVQERMGGAVAVEVVLDAGAPGGAARAAFLREVEAFRAWAATSDPIVRAAQAVTEGIAEAHVLFDGPREVPLDDAAAAQLLLVVQEADPDLVARLLDLPQARARVSLRLDVVGSSRYQPVLDRLEAEARRRFEPLGARAHLTGSAVLLARMKDYVLATQLESFALALVVVCLLVALGAGSWRLALLAPVPNALPVLGVLGLMGWAGIALEVSNALLATVAIGVVVDDTVHFLYHYRRARASGADRHEALGATYAGAGRAIWASTLVLALAFAVYLGSSLSNVRAFGLLAALCFVLALACDLLLLPALLLLGGRVSASRDPAS